MLELLINSPDSFILVQSIFYLKFLLRLVHNILFVYTIKKKKKKDVICYTDNKFELNQSKINVFRLISINMS